MYTLKKQKLKKKKKNNFSRGVRDSTERPKIRFRHVMLHTGKI